MVTEKSDDSAVLARTIPWHTPRTPFQRIMVAGVILVSVALPPAIVLYGEPLVATLTDGVTEIEYRIVWMITTHVSLLAVWLTLRTRALSTILGWSAVAMLVYLAAVLLLFLLLMAGKFVDWPAEGVRETCFTLSLYGLAAFVLIAVGVLTWRELWWQPSVESKSGLLNRHIFSLRRMLAWTTVCVCLVWAIGAIRWLEKASIYHDLHALAVLSFVASCYTVLVVAWLAPRGWIVKLFCLPLVCAAAVGLVTLEFFLLHGYLRSIWQLAVIAAYLIALGVYHAITLLVLLLPLRIAGVFMVDSVLGGERLDRIAGEFMCTRSQSRGTRE